MSFYPYYLFRYVYLHFQCYDISNRFRLMETYTRLLITHDHYDAFT